MRLFTIWLTVMVCFSSVPVEAYNIQSRLDSLRNNYNPLPDYVPEKPVFNVITELEDVKSPFTQRKITAPFNTPINAAPVKTEDTINPNKPSVSPIFQDLLPTTTETEAVATPKRKALRLEDYTPTKTPPVLESQLTEVVEPVVEEPQFTEAELTGPHQIPESVFETIQNDPHLGRYGSLAPDLLAKVQHEVLNTEMRERGITTLLSVGVTDYGNSTDDRVYNIDTSLQKFDDMIVENGEIFSFLRPLGWITEKEYKETKVILGGESVTGLGGGICQSSTTMRRAALFAGLPEIARREHSFAVYHYGPLQGLDTAVWSPGLDYKFKNDTGHPILIRTVVRGSKVMVFFFGTKNRNTVLVHQYQTGSIMTGMESRWKREIYHNDSHTPYVHYWTSKYKEYKKGDE